MARAVTGVLALFVAIAGCEDSRYRPGGGYGGSSRPPADSGTSGQPDNGVPGTDGSALPFDGAVPPWDGTVPPPIDIGFPTHDSGVRPDFGIVYPDATAPPPDAGFVYPDATPPPHDAGFYDSGVLRDASVTGVQASIVPSSSTLEIDFRAGAPADAVSYRTTLQYDNGTRSAALVAVTSAELSALIITQTFAAGPDHLAAPGQSTAIIEKIAGSGQPPFTADPTLAQILCLLPVPVGVTLGLNTGQTLTDSVPITCLQ